MKYLLFILTFFISLSVYATPAQSVGAIEFADAETLFVADSDNGKIYAYKLQNEQDEKSTASFNHKNFGSSVAQLFGVTDRDLIFHDMATHPATGEVWVSLTVRDRENSQGIIIRTNAAQQINVVDLGKLEYTVKTLSNVADDGVKFWRDIPATTLAITDLDYVDGTLYVSGLSTGEFASTLRQIPFPFTDVNDTSSIEIYHTVHNQTETRAPIRAMTVLDLAGEQTVVAAYTCTPLVTIPTKSLNDGAHVRGKTVAELGYGNTPLDIVHFTAPNQNQQPEEFVMVIHKERDADLIRVADLVEASKKESLSTPELWSQAGVRSLSLPLSGVLQVADQDEQYLATLKRNFDTGNVDLVSFRKGAYFRLSDFISEYNFPDYQYQQEQEFFRNFQNLLKRDAGYPDLQRELAN